MTANDLINFETEIANLFNAAKIRAPVHLYSGNEAQMIEVFRDVRPEDWVCCSWRSHYQCLLKGVPPEQVHAEILAGRSISLCFPEYRVISSAIVGGILPIAVGIALGLKRQAQPGRVHCFMGDMTSETGIASECIIVFLQPRPAYPVHCRGQRQVRLHRHARVVEPAGVDLREDDPPLVVYYTVPDEVSPRRCRHEGPVLAHEVF